MKNKLEVCLWGLIIFFLVLAFLTACKDEKRSKHSGHIEMGYSFEVPKCSDPVKRSDGIHYVTRKRYANESMSGTMYLEYRIIGDGELVPTEGTAPTLSLYFQRINDDWSAEHMLASYRWFSKTRPPVEFGSYSLSVPLEYQYWVPVVNSKWNTEQMFNEAKAKTQRVGFTLGGSSGAGHGVCVKNGSAKFVIDKFEITPKIVE